MTDRLGRQDIAGNRKLAHKPISILSTQDFFLIFSFLKSNISVIIEIKFGFFDVQILSVFWELTTAEGLGTSTSKTVEVSISCHGNPN